MTLTANRLRKLRRKLLALKCDAMLVTDVSNVRYVTGFTGEDSYALIGEDAGELLTDSRYTEQAGDECPDFRIHTRKGAMLRAVAERARRLGVRRLAFESEALTFQKHHALAAELDGKVELEPAPGVIEGLRLIKDAGEVKLILESIRVAEEAFRGIRAFVRPGVTERQVANELERLMRDAGADKASFDVIVAAQERASMPHARPSGRRIRAGDAVLFDWGAFRSLYASDLTRVLFVSRISSRLRDIYSVVLEAQRRALRRIKGGVGMAAVDKAARSLIDKSKYRNRFGHGLGHGIGLQIHEAPSLGPSSDGTLRPGMVVTVEPGIYLPGKAGVRIEDDVRVTRNGCEVLSSLEKDIDAMMV